MPILSSPTHSLRILQRALTGILRMRQLFQTPKASNTPQIAPRNFDG